MFNLFEELPNVVPHWLHRFAVCQQQIPPHPCQPPQKTVYCLRGEKRENKSNCWEVLFILSSNPPLCFTTVLAWPWESASLDVLLLRLGVPSAAWSGHCPSSQYTDRLPVPACWPPTALQDAVHRVSLLIACEAPPAAEWAQMPTGEGDASPFLKQGELLEGMLAP